MEEIILYHNRLNWTAYRAVNNKILEATANFRHIDGSICHLPIMKTSLLPNDDAQIATNKMKAQFPGAKIEVMT
jgi:hypothetical protein